MAPRATPPLTRPPRRHDTGGSSSANEVLVWPPQSTIDGPATATAADEAVRANTTGGAPRVRRGCPHPALRGCKCVARSPLDPPRRKGRRLPTAPAAAPSPEPPPSVPAYYLTTLPDGRTVCEDERLWQNALHRWRWMAMEGDDLLDEDEREASANLLTGFARARAELAERQAAIKREYLTLVRLAGEPEIRVADAEVIPLLDEVRHDLAAWQEAVTASLERRRHREQVRGPSRRQNAA